VLIGALVLRERNKLTLLTSPAINRFGLWVEQLIAESTGKEGKGIIPVVGEPVVEPAGYGNDRLFIYLRLAGDENSATDSTIEHIKSSGQPSMVLELQDKYDLGSEFFRWEFATAIAGAILSINPFDQPDVQATKQATHHVLQQYVTSGKLPQAGARGSFADLMAKASAGNYLAIMAYTQETADVDRITADIRRKVVERYHIATTLGYGPRYLHSTGQLHKGGPETGLFLLVTTDHEKDLAIPGEPYTFGTLADAQAMGDFQALQSLGRPIVRIHLDQGDTASLSELVNKLT